MTSRLWIFTPVYFDVPSFLILRERLAQHGARIVVADDSAGRDPAIAALHELDDVDVVEPPFNLGHQRALVYAIRTMAPEIRDEDVIVTLDADGEDKPEDLPRLIDELRAETSERAIVMARRTSRSEPPLFRVGYFFFKLGFRLLTGVVVRTGNFAAYRGWVARHLLSHPQFDLSYSAALIALNLPVAYVPCARGERYAGRSKMGYSKLLLHGLSMLMPFTDRIVLRALITFTVTLALTALAAFSVILVKLFTDEAIPGWATYTLLLMIVLSFTAMGNLVLLFSVFAQNRAISLAQLERRP
ncbi:glycosyltransferase [Solirubrobacter sp. CPCC 204708]|uniref:Glycosyltransferase n=1 Tax=Solirubrobacter deserti TaxID=2282478 RepID=A0ABT4RNC7_9ACTN|nr:glycosyltransferase [Solirubrobacter deserti]MBE2317445.1 glycosyltransferase [Solirubrobacter deserti]MDA0140027.1 glycosyltransferase [Solirubrobacter deserti]